MSDAVALAGALSLLSEPDLKGRLGIDVTRIVGASSGALNAVFYRTRSARMRKPELAPVSRSSGSYANAWSAAHAPSLV